MPKPTPTGSSVWRLMRSTWPRDRLLGRRLGAGDAEHRDVVDEARRCSSAPPAGACRRWSASVRRIESMPAATRVRLDRVGFLGRQIDDDEAVDARRLRRPCRSARRRDVDRDCSSPSAGSACRRRRPCGSGAPCRSVASTRHAGLQRPLAGELDRGPSAIGSENGMPSSIRSAPAAGRAFRICIAECRQSGSPAHDNRRRAPAALVRLSCGEALRRCGRHRQTFIPRCAATVATSLSPRPERFITSRSVLAHSARASARGPAHAPVPAPG